MSREYRGANINRDSPSRTACKCSPCERLPGIREALWTLENDPKQFNVQLSHFVSTMRIKTISASSSVVEHNDDSSPSNSRRGVHFTHEPGVLRRHFSHLRLLFYSCSCLHLFWTKEPMNWQTYKERLSTILNQQVSASETLIWKHLSSLLIGWTPVVRHVSLPQVNILRWWVGFVVAWQQTPWDRAPIQ